MPMNITHSYSRVYQETGQRNAGRPYACRNSQRTDAQTANAQTTEAKALGEEETALAKASEQSDAYQNYKERKKENEDAEVSKQKDMITEMKNRIQSTKDAYDRMRKNRKNLYDATADLMAIQAAEKEPSLKAIHTRLLFEARMMKSTGAQSSEVKIAVTKIKKVIGKLKTKIKNLKKEALLEKRAENARKAKQRRLEEAVRRELALRRKVRKEREQKDVEESRMGMGANYGGPAGSDPVSLELSGEMVDLSLDQALLEADMSGGGLAASFDAVAADVGGAAAIDAGVSIDLAL